MAKIICTVTNDLSYDQRMIRICRSLTQAGYEVLLVGRVKPNSIPLKTRSFQQKRLLCRFNKGKLFYLEYNLRLLLFFRRQKFDGLCAVDLDTLAPAFIWSRLRQKPLIYDAHEYFTEVPELIDRPMVKSLWSGLAHFIIPKLKYAYTVGPQLARILSEKYTTPFAVIRNLPIRDTAEKVTPTELPSKEEQDFILLYQGALNEGRGIETALDAMLLLPPFVKLWLVGEGDLSTILRAQSAKKNMKDRVQFLGFRPPEELRAITLKADLGLNLLEQKGLSYYYSLANKCFDYIQAGLPAIHMDFPEYRALHQQYPAFLLLPELKASALAQFIQYLLDNQQEYQALQTECLQAAKELNWEKEEKKLLAFYNQIYSSAPG